MLRFSIAALSAAALMTLTLTPANASGYIPLGPKHYTDHPAVYGPGPDIITTTPAQNISTGGGVSTPSETGGCSSPSYVFTERFGASWCNAGTIAPTGGGYIIPGTRTVKAGPDVVVTPAYTSCSQFGLGHNGFDYYSC